MLPMLLHTTCKYYNDGVLPPVHVKKQIVMMRFGTLADFYFFCPSGLSGLQLEKAGQLASD